MKIAGWNSERSLYKSLDINYILNDIPIFCVDGLPKIWVKFVLEIHKKLQHAFLGHFFVCSLAKYTCDFFLTTKIVNTNKVT